MGLGQLGPVMPHHHEPNQTAPLIKSSKKFESPTSLWQGDAGELVENIIREVVRRLEKQHAGGERCKGPAAYKQHVTIILTVEKLFLFLRMRSR